MQLQEMTGARLRRLSETPIASGRVISLHLDLDPQRFATPPARESEIRSASDELGRRIDAVKDEVDHDELTALREDLARIEHFFAEDFSAEGAHGLAIFACGPAGLWEVVRLAHPVDTQVAVDTRPHLEQLVADADASRWAVVAVSRAQGRILRGTPHRLVEVVDRQDDVHGQHQQGGWSQARYERSVDRDADAHIEAVLGALHRLFLRRRFDHLLLVGGAEVWQAVERHLHPDLQPLVAARVDGEVEHSSPDDLLALARPEMERAEEEHERAVLGRLREGLGTGGRAVAGLQPTLDMLLQQRVEVLLLADGAAAPGAACPACGWMGDDPAVTSCPVDGEPLEQHEDVVEVAVGAALRQDASVLVVPRRDDPADPESGPSPGFLELQGHGGVAAVLRF